MINVVKDIKGSFTGDIYKDFYNFGNPCSYDSKIKNWHKFTTHLMKKEELEHFINEMIVISIQTKFFSRDDYLKLKEEHH